MTIDQHVQPTELGVSVNLEDKPENFIKAFETTPLTAHHIYDAARFAVYSPNLYVSERRKAITQAFKDYSRGRLLLSETENDTVLDPYEIVETYVDQEIEAIRRNIETGIDRSTFDIQMDTIKGMEVVHQAVRRGIREKISELKLELSTVQMNLLISRQKLAEILSSEDLAAFDKQNGLEELLAQLPPQPTPPPTEPPELSSTFESVIENGHGMPAGTLAATGAIKEPPQTAEVPIQVPKAA